MENPNYDMDKVALLRRLENEIKLVRKHVSAMLEAKHTFIRFETVIYRNLFR